MNQTSHTAARSCVVLLAALAATSTSQAQDDVVNLWLASGAHGTPCRITQRCGPRLACDPSSGICLKPGALRVQNVDLTGCRGSTEFQFTATNDGEMSVTEKVEFSLSAYGTAWYGVCYSNDVVVSDVFADYYISSGPQTHSKAAVVEPIAENYPGPTSVCF